MSTNVSNIDVVPEWDEDLADQLVLNNVILILYIILGISGNSVVLYVYKFKFSGMLGDRYFVPFLAVTDLLASTVCGYFGVVLNKMQATFFNSKLCKTWWFFAAFTTFMSTSTLLVIAIQRYFKVVKPLEKQMDMKMNRIALGIVFVIAVVCSTPTTVLYGLVQFSNADGSVNGTRCGKLNSKHKTASIVYGFFVGITAITTICSLIGLYVKIGRTFFLRIKGTKFYSKTSEESSSSIIKSFIEKHTIDTDDNRPELNRVSRSQSTENKSKSVDVALNNCPISSVKRYNFTLMFMFITVIFLIGYIPKVIIMFMEALNPRFWEEFSDTGRAAMLFVYQLYIINNISKPFVYAFLDMKFQAELRKLCSGCSASQSAA